MDTTTVTTNTLIARRQPPGDRWSLLDNEYIYPSLTETLEAYFQKTGEPCHFRLEPLNGELFTISEDEEIVKEAPIKRFNIYGEDIEE